MTSPGAIAPIPTPTLRSEDLERDLAPQCMACGRGQLTLGRLAQHVLTACYRSAA